VQLEPAIRQPLRKQGLTLILFITKTNKKNKNKQKQKQKQKHTLIQVLTQSLTITN
jgi:hypothetical protein